MHEREQHREHADRRETDAVVSGDSLGDRTAVPEVESERQAEADGRDAGSCGSRSRQGYGTSTSLVSTPCA